MPNVSDMIQSKWLSKNDVLGAPLVGTIKGVTLEKFGQQRPGDKDSAWILWFNELPKGLKLNTTNIRILEASYGPNSDRWVGRRVQIYNDPTIQMAGQVVGGVRLRCSTAAAGGVAGALSLPAGARFDPITGAPLAAPPAPAMRFDPMTGAPIDQTPGAQSSSIAPEFNDDIPF